MRFIKGKDFLKVRKSEEYLKKSEEVRRGVYLGEELK